MRTSRTTLAFALLLTTTLLMATPVISQTSPYAPNVTSSQSTTVAISGGGGTVDDTSTTGVSATISGATGVSSATVQTQSLNAPSTGVGSFQTSGTATYFDVQVTLPTGTTAPSGATVQVCFSNPSVTSTDTLEYWSGSSWTSATSVSVTGTTICGTVPLSALSGTNFVAAPMAAADYTLYYIAGFVVVIIVIVIAILVMRRPKKSP